MHPIEQKAMIFATEAHGEQLYSDDFPYVKHLGDVYNILEELDMDEPPLLVAAWLHDTIEDTEVTFDDLFSEFGRRIARLVFAVTNEEGENRAERHKHTYPKIKAAGRSAIALKLADRIANVEHSIKFNHSMFKMYKKEYSDFRQMLRMPGELKTMWARLDSLMVHKLED